MSHRGFNVQQRASFERSAHDPAAFGIGYHVRKVVFDNVRVTNLIGNRFVDIDGISDCTPNDPHPIVEIRHCTFNGDPVTLDYCGGDLTGVTIIP